MMDISVRKEGAYWVAECRAEIEHVAQGETRREAVRDCIDGLYEDMQFELNRDRLRAKFDGPGESA